MRGRGARSGRARGAWPRAALACLAAAPAGAGDLDLVVFGSLDAGAATFLSTGAKLAPHGLGQDGFVALASVGGGRREERPGCVCGRPAILTRYTAAGAALAGWQWVRDWGAVAVFAGPEGTMDLVTDGLAVAALPARWGLRLQGEAWLRPTPDTLVQATAILGTAREDVWLRAAWGARLPGPPGWAPEWMPSWMRGALTAWGAYLGPEASLYTDRTGYRKGNLGVHATQAVFGDYSLRLSAGVQVETGAARAAPYVALAVWAPW